MRGMTREHAEMGHRNETGSQKQHENTGMRQERRNNEGMQKHADEMRTQEWDRNMPMRWEHRNETGTCRWDGNTVVRQEHGGRRGQNRALLMLPLPAMKWHSLTANHRTLANRHSVKTYRHQRLNISIDYTTKQQHSKSRGITLQNNQQIVTVENVVHSID